jgi:hypothetical protein
MQSLLVPSDKDITLGVAVQQFTDKKCWSIDCDFRAMAEASNAAPPGECGANEQTYTSVRSMNGLRCTVSQFQAPAED